MEFYGAKDYFDCDRGILVTNGEIIDNAAEVAQKLGIEILFFNPDSLKINIANQNLTFDNIWLNYIIPLKGKTIIRSNGKSNTIIEVDWGGIKRLTSNDRKQQIDIEIFRSTINQILKHGSITRQEINQEYSKRASSGIMLILAQVPIFNLNTARPMSIELKPKTS